MKIKKTELINKGEGYVLLYGVVMDNSVRSIHCTSLQWVEHEINNLKGLDNIGSYLICVFEVKDYLDIN